jgi:predicted RNA-binding Zn-ribbon protein involved in translation (DUF1610 family)
MKDESVIFRKGMDKNWEGQCHNCRSSSLPLVKKDREGRYFECPACGSQHDNRDNLTGD